MFRCLFSILLLAMMAGLFPATSAEWICLQPHRVRVFSHHSQPPRQECDFVERVREFSYKLPGAIDALSASTLDGVPRPLGSTIRIAGGSKLAILNRSDGSWDRNRLAYSMESGNFFFIRGDVGAYGLRVDKIDREVADRSYLSLVEIPASVAGQPPLVEVGKLGIGGALERNPKTGKAVRSFSIDTEAGSDINQYMMPAEFLVPLVPMGRPVQFQLPAMRTAGSYPVKRCGAKLEVTNTDMLKGSLSLALGLGFGAISGSSEATLERSFERVVSSEFDESLAINLSVFAIPESRIEAYAFGSAEIIDFHFVYVYEYQYGCISNTRYVADIYVIDGSSSQEIKIRSDKADRSDLISGDVEFFEFVARIRDLSLDEHVNRFIAERLTTWR